MTPKHKTQPDRTSPRPLGRIAKDGPKSVEDHRILERYQIESEWFRSGFGRPEQWVRHLRRLNR